MTDAATNMRLKLPVTCFILEIILIILFGLLVQYDEDTDAKAWSDRLKNHSTYENEFYYRYPSEFPVNGVGSKVTVEPGGENSSLTHFNSI